MTNTKDLRIGNWVNIPNWEEYQISEVGEIYSKRRNVMLKVWKASNKYPRVTLSKNGIEKTFCIHKLVALAFIPNPENKRTVNHKDGNKLNNHVDNLEWATISENMIHAVSTGLCKPHDFGKGENHDSAKLNNVDIAMIRVLLNHDFTQKQIAKRFGVHSTHISAIKLNKTWTG